MMELVVDMAAVEAGCSEEEEGRYMMGRSSSLKAGYSFVEHGAVSYLDKNYNEGRVEQGTTEQTQQSKKGNDRGTC